MSEQFPRAFEVKGTINLVNVVPVRPKPAGFSIELEAFFKRLSATQSSLRLMLQLPPFMVRSEKPEPWNEEALKQAIEEIKKRERTLIEALLKKITEGFIMLIPGQDAPRDMLISEKALESTPRHYGYVVGQLLGVLPRLVRHEHTSDHSEVATDKDAVLSLMTSIQRFELGDTDRYYLQLPQQISARLEQMKLEQREENPTVTFVSEFPYFENQTRETAKDISDPMYLMINVAQGKLDTSASQQNKERKNRKPK